MKPYNFPLLNCNLGNKALILNLRISIHHCNVMHHLNGYINGHLESRKSDSRSEERRVGKECVP